MNIMLTLLITLGFTAAHPFHVSLTHCNYNAENGDLEITIRVFTDDISQAIDRTVANNEESYELLSAYLNDRFFLKDNSGKRLQPEFLGLETEMDVTYIFMRIRDFPKHSHYLLHHSLLFDMFDDQTNIVKLQISEKTASVFTTADEPTKQMKLE